MVSSTQRRASGVSELKSVFETIAAQNKWGDKESVSGAGSTLAYTYNLRHELADFVRAFEIGTIFDAPCGDFNWMRAVDFPPDLKYIGGEIVPALVEANSRSLRRRRGASSLSTSPRTNFPAAISGSAATACFICPIG